MKLPTRTAGLLVLSLLFLLLMGLQFLLLSRLDARLSVVRSSYRFWAMGAHLDLINQLPPRQRRAVLLTMERQLQQTRQAGYGAGATLRDAVGACARSSDARACAKVEAIIEESRDHATDQFAMLSEGGNFVLVALLLAFVGLSFTMAWMAWGYLKLLAILGGMAWVVGFGMQVKQLSESNHRARTHIAVDQLATRVRLVVELPAATMKPALEQLRKGLARNDAIPAKQRDALGEALVRCGNAASREARWQRLCRKRPALCVRPRVRPTAVACPRVTVPLARLRNAALARPLGQDTNSWLMGRLQTAGALCLLLTLLLAVVRREQPE